MGANDVYNLKRGFGKLCGYMNKVIIVMWVSDEVIIVEFIWLS